MSRGLRILVIGSGWPAETFLEGLYRGLAERGVELWIASRHPLSGAPPGIRRLALPTVRGGRAGGSAHGIILGLGATLRRPAAVWRRLRDGGGALDDLPFLGRRFDLLYFPWNASAVRHLPLMRTGIPSLVSCRGAHIQVAPSNPERRALVAGLPETFTLAAAVHCVSHAMVDAARPLGLDPAKATVIPPAVDLEAFLPTPAREPTPGEEGGPFRLLATGSLIWRKGLEYALRAVDRLRRDGHPAELTILGDGPERRRLLFTLQELGLAEAVRLPGRVEPGELRRYLAASHAFVLPSLSEGISNAALEAMACGLPVVSTRVGGMAEAIDDGESGLLVPPRDPEAMAHAVRRLIQDPALGRGLGAAARRRVERDFELGQQVQAFLDLCRRAADGDR